MIDWHRPLTATGRAVVRRRIAEVWDKGSAAVIVLEDRVEDGAPLLTTRSTWIVSGGGGFGGERGPGSANIEVPPDRSPDVQRSMLIRPEQAALYRLSGDLNPIHVDPTTAEAAGFEEPFLHGLCTFGIAALAVLDDVCEGDPGRMEGLQARFTAPVLPGDEIVVEIWRTDDGAQFQGRVGDLVVLAGGLARLRA
jgi:acyl dehydratase